MPKGKSKPPHKHMYRLIPYSLRMLKSGPWYLGGMLQFVWTNGAIYLFTCDCGDRQLITIEKFWRGTNALSARSHTL